MPHKINLLDSHMSRILLISGSTRSGSTNSALLRTAAACAPADIDAVYELHAPALRGGTVDKWGLDATLDEIASTAGFDAPEKRKVTWTQRYTTDEYVALQETHSDHRMLPDAQRQRLHAALGQVADAHGGEVDVVYDVELYLARRTLT